MKPKCAYHCLGFYTPKGTSLENSVQLPETVLVWVAPYLPLIRLSVGCWEQWNSNCLLVGQIASCPLPATPLLPQQPPEDIKALSWNRQVQHILSSAHPSGKAVVWDLRKNEPIIKVSDHSSRVSHEAKCRLGLWLLSQMWS